MAAPSNTGYKPRYVSGFVNTAGSATLPQGALYAVAACGFSLLEASWQRTGSAAAHRVQLTELLTTGTPGATQGIGKYDDDGPAAQCTPVTVHTVAPTLGRIFPFRQLPTSAGTAIYLGYHDCPLEVPSGTANGIGWLPTTPSGPADVVFVWDE